MPEKVCTCRVHSCEDLCTMQSKYARRVQGIDKDIGAISVSKSSGIDNITSRVLKDFMTLAIRGITHLYSNIIDSGIYPDKVENCDCNTYP